MCSALSSQTPLTPVEIFVENDFDFLSEEYSKLYQASNVSVFQAPFWLDGFYRNLVPAVGSKPCIITIRDKVDGALQAMLPLARQSSFGAKILQSADLGISDYNCVIGEETKLSSLMKDADACQALLQNMAPFDILLFRKQPQDCFDLSKILPTATKVANKTSAYEVNISPGFEEWQKEALSKATRKGMARKRRGIIADHDNTVFRTLYEAEEISHAFNALRSFRAKRFEDDFLSRPAYFDFYRDLAIRHARSGETQVFVCEVDGRTITVDFGFLKNNVHYLILGGFDVEFKRYSPGMVSMLELMSVRRQEGVTTFDFTTGDEGYKNSFRAVQKPLSTVICVNSLLGRLAYLGYAKGGHFRGALKALAPNIR